MTSEEPVPEQTGKVNWSAWGVAGVAAMVTVVVGVIGFASAYFTANTQVESQRREAANEFVLSQRQTAYVDFVSAADASSQLHGEFPNFIATTRTAAEIRDQQVAINALYTKLLQAQDAVQLIGPSPITLVALHIVQAQEALKVTCLT